MLVLCHAHNTFDKRELLKQKNPLLKPVSVKMRQLVKDKSLRDFYLGLARDYHSSPEGNITKEKETAPPIELIVKDLVNDAVEERVRALVKQSPKDEPNQVPASAACLEPNQVSASDENIAAPIPDASNSVILVTHLP